MIFYLFSPFSMYFGILSYNRIVNAINLDGRLGVVPNDIAKYWDKEFDALYEVVICEINAKAIQMDINSF